MRLHSLSPEGLRLAYEALARVKSGESGGIDLKALSSSGAARDLKVDVETPIAGQISTRWELARWLHAKLAPHDHHLDAGAWSWLAMCLFDIICPFEDDVRTVRQFARYLLEADDFRKAHRHLLKGPYLLMQAHADAPDTIKGLLATRPDAPGEVYEQLVTRKFLITSRAVVSVATELYFDPVEQKLKRGAGGSGAGSPRRYVEVLQQFDLTFDLQRISPEALRALLPREFSKLLRSPARDADA